MKRGMVAVFIILSFMILSFTVVTTRRVQADIPPSLDSGWAGTIPLIDAHMSPGEWAGATVQNFAMQMRYSTNSLNRTLQGTLYVENNWTYAFIAVQIYNDDYEAHDLGGHYKLFAIVFNDNDNGTLGVGDNGEGVTTWNSTFSPFYKYNDLYYYGSGWDSDSDIGKTNDGAFNWSHTNPTEGAIGNWTFEMMIPLKGTDLGYDFNIGSLPYTVGFKIWFQEYANGLSGVYPDSSSVPLDQTVNAATFGDLTFQPLYNLTMIAGTGGTTNPSPGVHQYPYNTAVSAGATADPGYTFDHWELDSVNVGSANPYSVTMNQNHTLKALFTPIPTGRTVGGFSFSLAKTPADSPIACYATALVAFGATMSIIKRGKKGFKYSKH
jgi:hypothetical protein